MASANLSPWAIVYPLLVDMNGSDEGLSEELKDLRDGLVNPIALVPSLDLLQSVRYVTLPSLLTVVIMGAIAFKSGKIIEIRIRSIAPLSLLVFLHCQICPG